jgi:HicB_like antitoxin of bacterial toxin-antitoxin system
VASATKLEQVQKLAQEGLARRIAEMVANGESLPDPLTLDDLQNDREMRGEAIILVRLDQPAPKIVRATLTLADSQLKIIDRLAAKAGLTRSAYMTQCALRPGGICE